MALPGDVVRISFPKERFSYMGGQYVFICIPKVTAWEWHPFSLSSSPDDDTVLLHVRVLGNWTRSLYKLAASKGGDEGNPVEVSALINVSASACAAVGTCVLHLLPCLR